MLMFVNLLEDTSLLTKQTWALSRVNGDILLVHCILFILLLSDFLILKSYTTVINQPGDPRAVSETVQAQYPKNYTNFYTFL